MLKSNLAITIATLKRLKLHNLISMKLKKINVKFRFIVGSQRDGML